MKKIPLVIWPIVGIFLLLVTAAFFLFKVPEFAIFSSKAVDLISGEALKMSDIKYSQDYKSGQGKWELVAKEARFFDKSQVLVLRDVSLTLDSAKELSYTLRGTEGEYCRKSGKITLRGGVEGRSSNGYHLETSLLIFRQKNESVETDKAVRVTGPFFKVNGEGLYIDLKKKTFLVRRNVRTTITKGDFL